MTSEFRIFSGLKSSYEAACEEGQKKLLFFIQFQTFVFTSTSSHFSLFSLQSLSLPIYHLPSKLEHFEFPSAFQLLFYSPFYFHFLHYVFSKSGPGLFSHLLTLCTLVLVLATLPFSLFFVVKVVQVGDLGSLSPSQGCPGKF